MQLWANTRLLYGVWRIVLSVFACGLLAVISLPVTAAQKCTVIAHRGASAYLPEHSTGAYQLAIKQGADFIEPDVILSKDGIAVVRHENSLQQTTDIAQHPEFADRRRATTIDGRKVDDWFSEDFRAAELATLRATERYPELRPASAGRNGHFPLLSLQQVITLMFQSRETTGQPISLYPELKQVEYFAERGLDSVQIVLDTLARNGLTGPGDGVMLQSYDAAALRRAAELTDLPLVQLLGNGSEADIAAETSPAALARIAEYADGIGVPKYGYVIAKQPTTVDEAPQITALVENAHKAGLFVHVYTFRAENKFLPPAFRRADDSNGDLASEMRMFLAADIDGFFTDNPDIGRAVCDAYAAQ